MSAFDIAPLEFAKRRFTTLLKNFRNRVSFLSFDFVIAVQQRKTEPLRNCATDRRFSGTHETDEIKINIGRIHQRHRQRAARRIANREKIQPGEIVRRGRIFFHLPGSLVSMASSAPATISDQRSLFLIARFLDPVTTTTGKQRHGRVPGLRRSNQNIRVSRRAGLLLHSISHGRSVSPRAELRFRQ
jgi:hypothetical protein